jgi:winged helix-turn-helix DNA-binding protein
MTAAQRFWWSCEGCKVTVRYAAGHVAPEQPLGWEQIDGDWLCIVCARDTAAEAALAAGEVDSHAEGVCRHLLLRDADMANKAIANASKLPPHRVALMRRKLTEAGLIERRPPGPKPATEPKPKPRPAKRQRIEAALRAGSSRSNRAIAAEVGVSHSTVRAHRRRLEAAGEIQPRGSSPRIAASEGGTL